MNFTHSSSRTVVTVWGPILGTGSFSGVRILAEALRGHVGWRPMWRAAAPKVGYDVVIVGGGGHGLATAHYLAAEHGIANVAVLEKGAIGLGNVGRNTTIVRSNYFEPENIRFYDLAQALGALRAGSRLQRDGEPARHPQPVPCRGPARPLR